MSLTIELPVEIQEDLREKAAEHGLSVSSFVESAIRKELNAIRQKEQSPISVPPSLTTEQWVAEFRAWTASHRHLPHEADDSRESIYAGRGE
jgi:hypothetical protein